MPIHTPTRHSMPSRIAVLLSLLVLTRPAGAENLEALRKDFTASDPPKTLGPLFWLHGDEDEQLIRHIIGKMDEGGCCEFTIESRPHKFYLQQKWWDDLAVCFDEAEKRGMKVWIFDEKWFPSGMAGGLVQQANPTFERQYLVAHRKDITGPGTQRITPPKGDRVIAIVAGKVTGKAIDPDSLRVVDSAGAAPAEPFPWKAPQGQWAVFAFVQGHHGRYVDSLSSACFDTFIKLTHQATYDRYKDKFGTLIQGFFTDEPGFHNHGGQFPWTFGFFDIFRSIKGYDLKRLLPALVADVGPDTHAIRFDYWDAVVTRYAEVFYKKIGDWCEAHGVRHIGHHYEHNHLHYSFGAGPGHLFRTQQYMHMGGIDLVCGQVWPETRSLDYWGMPKLASSISHIYGMTDDLAMNESFGAHGWRCGLTDMKWLTDWQCVRGINTIVPHAFNPRWPDEDCPPFFYARGHNPQWKHFRIWADYTNRLCHLLRKGTFVGDAIVLYPAESHWIGWNEPVEEVQAALQKTQVDYDLVPYEFWSNPRVCRIRGDKIHIQMMAFKVVVLPGVDFIPVRVLERLKAFAEAGGIVIASSRLPSRSCDRGQDAKVAELVKQIWSDALANRVQLAETKPELQALLRSDLFEPDVQFWPGHEGLRVLHRRRAGADIYLLTNEWLDETVDGELSVRGHGRYEWWDATTGSCEPVRVSQVVSGRTLIPLRLQPFESRLLVRVSNASPDQAARVVWTHGGRLTHLSGDGQDVTLRAIAQPPANGAKPSPFAAATFDGDTVRFASSADITCASQAVPNHGWTLELNGKTEPAKLGSWTTRAKRFTGTGIYRRAIDVPPDWLGQGRILLDLGRVEELAEVRVNGTDTGVRICPPYQVDVTRLAKAGRNQVEVAVINTLSNRLDGKSRWAHAQDSGLLGPVALRLHRVGELRVTADDAAPDVVLDPHVRVTSRAVKITWRTVRASLGSVRFGKQGQLDKTAKESGLPRTYHAVELRDLAPEQTYQAVVEGTDKKLTFTTPTRNLLLKDLGGKATASSTLNDHFPPSSVIDGDAVGKGWQDHKGGWNDATKGAWPDWIAVELPRPTKIGRVVVTTLQDAFSVGNWSEPSPDLRFTKYGIIDVDVQLRHHGAWVTVAEVRGNDRVQRDVTFKPRAADAVRVVIHKSMYDYSRVVELEAYSH